MINMLFLCFFFLLLITADQSLVFCLNDCCDRSGLIMVVLIWWTVRFVIGGL